MPALQADIARGTRDAETVTWQSATIAARYPTARDGSQSPNEGYFDDPADALTMLLDRASLIGREADRYATAVAAPVWLDLAQFPSARLTDTEYGVDAVMLNGRVEIDLDVENTNLELFG